MKKINEKLWFQAWLLIPKDEGAWDLFTRPTKLIATRVRQTKSALYIKPGYPSENIAIRKDGMVMQDHDHILFLTIAEALQEQKRRIIHALAHLREATKSGEKQLCLLNTIHASDTPEDA